MINQAQALAPQATTSATRAKRPPGMLTRRDAQRHLGFSRMAVDDMIASGRFPDGVAIAKRTYWFESDLDLWLGAQCPTAEEFRQIKARKLGLS